MTRVRNITLPSSTTYLEAYTHAVEIIRGWGLPPIIFELSSEHYKKSYTSAEAQELDLAFERWFDSLGKKE